MPELKGSVLFPAADNFRLNGPITRQPGLCRPRPDGAVRRDDNGVTATYVLGDPAGGGEG